MRLVRPSLLHKRLRSPTLLVQPHINRPPPRRHFLTDSPLSSLAPSPIRLAASRTLSHPPSAIYSIVADVPSYSTFLPYCVSSSVTAWSQPDARTGKRWPAAATLAVGFKGFEERLASKVYCVPERIVESLAGSASTELDPANIAHYKGVEPVEEGLGGRGGGSEMGGEGLMKYLVSRWTLEPIDEATKTNVRLNIEFEFSSPIYAQLSRAAAPAVAEVLVKAFEERVEEVLGRKR